MRHTIHVLVLALGYTTLLTGCSRSNNAELAQARTEAEAAKAEAAAAKSELAKFRAEAPVAESPATVPKAQPAPAKDEAKAGEPVLRVGQPAPPLHLKKLLQAPADAPATLEKLKGKAVVLEFWGTWCVPCVAAFPHLNELVKETKGEPVVFIAVTDEPADKVAAFLEKKTLATWVGIDDRGATTLGYGIRSFPTTVLIDPDGVVRGVTMPTGVTAAMLKDLANRRPVKLRPEDLPRLRTDQGGGIDLGQADFLVYLGPPNALLGNQPAGPNESRNPRLSARALLQRCYREEAGGPIKSPRVVFECDIPEKDFGYAVRVPKDSGLSQFGLLKQALESSLGFRTRGVREHRDQDVLVLKHVGPAAPAKAGGNAALGARVMYPPNAIIGEGATLNFLSAWIERQTKKPVLDETGLAGEYDWRIKVKSLDLDDLNAALKDIGLALTPERRKVEYIVVRRFEADAAKPTTTAQEEKEPIYQGKPLSEWLKQLRSTKAKDRKEAASVLAMNIGAEGKAAVPALSESLKDEDKDVRYFAADALGGIGKEAGPAAPALVKALKDKDPGVSSSAAFTLFVLGPEAKAAVPDLVEALKGKDPGVRAGAAFILGGIGKEAKAAAPALIEALKDPDVRVSAADALGGIGKEAKAAVPALIEALKDKDPGMRVSTAGALYRIGAEGKVAVAALTEALKDKAIGARKFAACALGKIGPEAKEAVPALKEALKEKTRDVRQAAAWALFAIDPKAGVPEPLTRYRAYIGTSPKGFERDDVPGSSFSEVRGQGGETTNALLLWVNGDPVGFFYTSDWREVALTRLRPGKNELTFSGKHPKPVYVKIDRWGGGGFAGQAGKRKFPGPGGEDREEPLLFQVERAPKLPELEELSDRPVDRARYEKELRAAIAELKDLVRGGKGQEAARLLGAGPLLWAEAVEGFTPEEVRKEFLDPMSKALSDPKVKAVDEGRPLRLIFGKRQVLAYVEPPAKEEYSRHLFAAERDGKQTHVGPFQLARVDGKWIFWDTEIGWDK